MGKNHKKLYNNLEELRKSRRQWVGIDEAP